MLEDGHGAVDLAMHGGDKAGEVLIDVWRLTWGGKPHLVAPLECSLDLGGVALELEHGLLEERGSRAGTTHSGGTIPECGACLKEEELDEHSVERVEVSEARRRCFGGVRAVVDVACATRYGGACHSLQRWERERERELTWMEKDGGITLKV